MDWRTRYLLLDLTNFLSGLAVTGGMTPEAWEQAAKLTERIEKQLEENKDVNA